MSETDDNLEEIAICVVVVVVVNGIASPSDLMPCFAGLSLAPMLCTE